MAPSIDGANALQIDESGNVYVTGSSGGSRGESDYVTIKYNNSSEVQWVARYNGTGNGYDNAKALAVDTSGNVYVTGSSFGSEGVSDYEYATIKYSPEGNELWVAHYNAPGNSGYQAEDIAVDANGNVYVTGRGAVSYGSPSFYATIKYNNAGVEQWVATYKGAGSGYATAITVDESGNVYVTGHSESLNSSVHSYDYVTIKYNDSGAVNWVARYNGPGDYSDYATDIVVDVGGNVYVTGESDSSYVSTQFATIKYNAAGVTEWVARANNLKGNRDVPSALAVDSLGNVYVTGKSRRIRC